MEVQTIAGLIIQCKEVLAMVILGAVIWVTYTRIIPQILFQKDQRLADTLENVGRSLDRFAGAVEGHTHIISKLEERLEGK